MLHRSRGSRGFLKSNIVRRDPVNIDVTQPNQFLMKHILLLVTFSIVLCAGCDRPDPSPIADQSFVDRSSSVDPPLADETSPESVLRTFLLAMAERDAETLMRVGNGEEPLELLLSGPPLTEAQLIEATKQIDEMDITQLKAGDTFPYPGGGEICARRGRRECNSIEIDDTI